MVEGFKAPYGDLSCGLIRAMIICRITIRRIGVLPKICSVEFTIHQISGSSNLT